MKERDITTLQLDGLYRITRDLYVATLTMLLSFSVCGRYLQVKIQFRTS